MSKNPKVDPAPYMEELTAAYPKTAEAFDIAARSAAWLSNDPAASAKYIQRALELRPGFGSGYNTLGYNYMALGQMEKAKAPLRNTLNCLPKNPMPMTAWRSFIWKIKSTPKRSNIMTKQRPWGCKIH